VIGSLNGDRTVVVTSLAIARLLKARTQISKRPIDRVLLVMIFLSFSYLCGRVKPQCDDLNAEAKEAGFSPMTLEAVP